MGDWIYNGAPVTDEDVVDYAAFVYEIENTMNGRKYIGKKRLKIKKSKPPLKGKKKRRISYEPSDWKTYYGSNDELLEDAEKIGHDKFVRRILRFCKTLGESSYYEARYQFETDAIIRDDYYNRWVSVKVTSKHLGHLQKKQNESPQSIQSETSTST